ncbi:helix-turn-helix domain-containing protein [Magnetospirillum molischianum]|nr:HTH domain-containing protein [Magnetospirillum molischianum]
MADDSGNNASREREAEALSLLDRLFDRYESEDAAAQDTALTAAQSLCHAVWGGYTAGFEALAHKIETDSPGTVESALRSLRLREEATDPGCLIRAARHRREKLEKREADRAAVIARYGDEATARTATSSEARLIAAGRSLADPGDEDDPQAPLSGWNLPWHEPPESLRTLVATALPPPSNIVAARDECLQWEQRKRDLDLIGTGPGPAGLPTACAARHWLVERMWRCDLSATGPADLIARLEYWVERGGDDGSGYRTLLDDLTSLAGAMLRSSEGGSHARILRLKAENPDWSLARIGQELGISRQAVHKHLKRG